MLLYTALKNQSGEIGYHDSTRSISTFWLFCLFVYLSILNVLMLIKEFGVWFIHLLPPQSRRNFSFLLVHSVVISQ